MHRRGAPVAEVRRGVINPSHLPNLSDNRNARDALCSCIVNEAAGTAAVRHASVGIVLAAALRAAIWWELLVKMPLPQTAPEPLQGSNMAAWTCRNIAVLSGR